MLRQLKLFKCNLKVKFAMALFIKDRAITDQLMLQTCMSAWAEIIQAPYCMLTLLVYVCLFISSSLLYGCIVSSYTIHLLLYVSFYHQLFIISGLACPRGPRSFRLQHLRQYICIHIYIYMCMYVCIYIHTYISHKHVIISLHLPDVCRLSNELFFFSTSRLTRFYLRWSFLYIFGTAVFSVLMVVVFVCCSC